jgi:hypothetical protein
MRRRRATVAMALAFAIGSAGFVVGPFPGYLDLVGEKADGLTFFVASIFFTIGGALQSYLAYADRAKDEAGRAAWWAALIQSAGTLFFNRTTYRALDTAVSNPHYDKLVWRPDALGSICFLVSGFIAYRASARRDWLPLRGERGWWQPSVNLLGCIFFGISAIAGHVGPTTGSVLDLAAANLNTILGALCFFACAVGTLRALSSTSGDASPAPVMQRDGSWPT